MKKVIIQVSPIFLIITLFYLVQGCANSIDFQEDREDDYYSIYGLLSITDPNSFIRVHDNRIPIDDITENDIDVIVNLTNMNTGVTELLEREIITFEGAITHNFRTSSPLSFNTEYQVTLEDELGYRDTVNAVTPINADMIMSPTLLAPCTSLEVRIDISPVSEGEQVLYFVEFEWQGRLYRARRATQILESDDNLTLVFNIQNLFEEGFGTDTDVFCFQIPITEYRFEYTHYGRQVDEGVRLINEDGSVQIPYFGKRVLGSYTDGFEFAVSDTAFNYDYWFPPQKK